MTDFLDGTRKEIDSRLRELRPLVDEYRRLEQAAAALAAVPKGGSTRSAQRGSTRRRKSDGGTRGKPHGTGKRASKPTNS